MPFLLFAASGCGQSGDSVARITEEEPRFPDVTLRVGVLDDPHILNVTELGFNEWRKSRAGNLAMIPQPLTSPVTPASADVFLFRADRLGVLMDAGVLARIPEAQLRGGRAGNELHTQTSIGSDASTSTSSSASSSNESAEKDPIQYTGIAEPLRAKYGRYGKDVVALPLGGSALVLAYRRDLFQDPRWIEAAKAEGVTLTPPETWDQFVAQASFFQKHNIDTDPEPDPAVALALDAADPETAGLTVYSARAASLGLHPDQIALEYDFDTLNPRIEGPAFVRALEDIRRLARSGAAGEHPEKRTQAQARAEFRAGGSVFLLDRAEYAFAWTDESRPGNIGVVPFPGAKEVYNTSTKAWEPARPLSRPGWIPAYGVWMAGFSSALTGANKDAALDLVKYLVRETCTRHYTRDRTLPLLPVRIGQLGAPPNARGVDPRQWSQAVLLTYAGRPMYTGLRMPNNDQLLPPMARGIVQAVTEPGTAPEAILHNIAVGWNQAANANRQRLIWHYVRGLNIMETADQPPPGSASAP